jgi:hypothetical protein
MPNGTLKLYNKLDNTLLVSLDILGTFNIEDNLNDTPSNMKVKVITSNVYREEFQVNTIAYHEDTNSWWVIKSDESSYITTGEYEHEIQLVEYLEFYAYRHLPNCAFAPETYTLDNILKDIFLKSKSQSIVSESYETATITDYNNADYKITGDGTFVNYVSFVAYLNAYYPIYTSKDNTVFRGENSFSPGNYFYTKLVRNYNFNVVIPPFLDRLKTMPFFSFENYTVANAIKNIARAINAIPKMTINLADNGFVPTLTFINRNGIDTPIKNGLNNEFPIAYEKNMNSNDQFTTRSISNVQNAKSSNEIVSPRVGGFKLLAPNKFEYEGSPGALRPVEPDVRVFLPSKIDKINYLRIYLPVIIRAAENVSQIIYSGYYLDREFVRNKILNLTSTGFTGAELLIAANNLPDPNDFYKVELNGTINKNYNSTLSDNQRAPIFKNKLIVKSKIDYDYSDNTDVRERTIYWTPYTNELVMPLSIKNGLTEPSTLTATSTDHNPTFMLYDDPGSTDSIYIQVAYNQDEIGDIDKVKPSEILVQGIYQPIADIKVSIDNDNDAQDEKFFNQSGKVIDAVSVSKLITSHTNDSVEGTKIRNARYDKFPYQLFTGSITFFTSPPTSPSNGNYWFKTDTNELYERISGSWVLVPSTFGITTPVDGNQSLFRFVNTATQQLFISQLTILPLGQLVRDNNQLYVITQRSIDGMVKNSNEYYNVIYTLSRNRIARSENIVADSAVINYKIPDDNLVFRNQLYKDYIELSLQNFNQESPYLSISKALVFSEILAGTDFDYTVLAKNNFGLNIPTTVRYVKNPTIFDLSKSKLLNVDWQDNNVLGFRVENLTTTTYSQTPILYTDNKGVASNFELLFLSPTNLEEATNNYNTRLSLNSLVPFADLTSVPATYYNTDVVSGNRFTFKLNELHYDKDPFEIPVFSYMIQGNDDYNPKGNIVISNDLFSTFTGTIRYHYVINNTTRFTAENAIKLQSANAWSSANDRRTTITRTNANEMDLDLFSNFGTLTKNTSTITNVGVYAVQGGTGVVKFLFAINDYNAISPNTFGDIKVYINNWKI